MSLSKLKERLLKISEHPQMISRFYRDGLKIAENAFLLSDGYIYVGDKAGEKLVKYTVEKFFIHHKLSRREISDALRVLEDLSLLIKLEEGTLKAIEIIRCKNILIRQYLLRRYSYDRFMSELKCKVINKSGDNELIMIPLGKEEEPIMLVKVKDPSTGLTHLLRVPPNVRTCREAIAWTFGMTSEEYNPIVET
jgi:DNA-binding transcriptional ArsR family regulator